MEGSLARPLRTKLTFCLLILCYGCVPLSQQIADSEAAETEGHAGPLVLDHDTFYNAIFDWVYDPMKVDDELRPSDNNNTYHGTFEGNPVYIRNCRCFSKVKIVSDKLVVIHRYGGGESN